MATIWIPIDRTWHQATRVVERHCNHCGGRTAMDARVTWQRLSLLGLGMRTVETRTAYACRGCGQRMEATGGLPGLPPRSHRIGVPLLLSLCPVLLAAPFVNIWLTRRDHAAIDAENARVAAVGQAIDATKAWATRQTEACLARWRATATAAFPQGLRTAKELPLEAGVAPEHLPVLALPADQADAEMIWGAQLAVDDPGPRAALCDGEPPAAVLVVAGGDCKGARWAHGELVQRDTCWFAEAIVGADGRVLGLARARGEITRGAVVRAVDRRLRARR